MNTEYQDEHLRCSWKTDGEVCGREFAFTAKDQAFYAERQFSRPKYCREHREARKQQQQGPFGAALRESRSNSNNRGPRIPGQERDREQFGV